MLEESTNFVKTCLARRAHVLPGLIVPVRLIRHEEIICVSNDISGLSAGIETIPRFEVDHHCRESCEASATEACLVPRFVRDFMLPKVSKVGKTVNVISDREYYH